MTPYYHEFTEKYLGFGFYYVRTDLPFELNPNTRDIYTKRGITRRPHARLDKDFQKLMKRASKEWPNQMA